MCTLCVEAGSVRGTVVSASHTLIDVHITARALKPAHIKAQHINTWCPYSSYKQNEQCTDHKSVMKGLFEAKSCRFGLLCTSAAVTAGRIRMHADSKLCKPSGTAFSQFCCLPCTQPHIAINMCSPSHSQRACQAAKGRVQRERPATT